MKSIGIRVLWFAVGVSFGVLAVLLGQRWHQPETLVSAKVFLETNPNELISINSEPDAIARRKDLIAFIWGPAGFPAGLPEKN